MHKPCSSRRTEAVHTARKPPAKGTMVGFLLAALVFLSGTPLSTASEKVSVSPQRVLARAATFAQIDWRDPLAMILDAPILPPDFPDETGLLFSVAYLKLPGSKAASRPKPRPKPKLVTRPQGLPLKAQTHITSNFGTRVDPLDPAITQFHSGIDFAGSPGTHIFATARGKVLAAGWAGGYGNRVIIDHGQGIQTLYGHLNAIDVEPGAPVQYGQLIGRLGSTGRSTGPHLHYSVYREGVLIDPRPFLKLPGQNRCLKKARSRTCATLH